MQVRYGEGRIPDEVRSFLTAHHYLKGMPRGVKHWITLHRDGVLIGAAGYGEPVGAHAKYDMELKRFCLSVNEKNLGSWFMAKSFKELRKVGFKGTVVSYADPEQGHEGTLYKASNFIYKGLQTQGTPYYNLMGETVWQRNKFAARYEGMDLGPLLRKARKHIYIYEVG